MSFRRLVELSDTKIREDIGDFYFISKSRLDNMIYNLEEGAKKTYKNREYWRDLARVWIKKKN